MSDNFFKDIQNLIGKSGIRLETGMTFRLADTAPWVEATTPFSDIHGDLIQFYIRKNLVGYTFLDDTLGIYEVATQKNKDILNLVLPLFGVEQSRGQLKVEIAKEQDFYTGILRLLAAITLVDALVEKEQGKVTSSKR